MACPASVSSGVTRMPFLLKQPNGWETAQSAFIQISPTSEHSLQFPPMMQHALALPAETFSPFHVVCRAQSWKPISLHPHWISLLPRQGACWRLTFPQTEGWRAWSDLHLRFQPLFLAICMQFCPNWPGWKRLMCVCGEAVIWAVWRISHTPASKPSPILNK